MFITKNVSFYKLRQNLARLLQGEVISIKRDIEAVSFVESNTTTSTFLIFFYRTAITQKTYECFI